MNKLLNYFIVTVVILLGLGLYFGNTPKEVVKTKIVTKEVIKKVEVPPKNVVINVTIEDLQEYLAKTATHWSSKMRNTFLKSVAKASDKYGISPVILISIAEVESSYRQNITHTLVKGAKERAIGLMGIMPKLWLPELRKENIADTKYDLFTIEANVMASAYILAKYKNEPLKKGTTSKMQSAIRRYFGGNFKSYENRIKAKVGAIIFSKIYK